MTHVLSVQRMVVAVALLALLPLAAQLPAMVALMLLAGVLVGLVAFETSRFAEVREQIRHEDTQHDSDRTDG